MLNPTTAAQQLLKLYLAFPLPLLGKLLNLSESLEFIYEIRVGFEKDNKTMFAQCQAHSKDSIGGDYLLRGKRSMIALACLCTMC